MPLSDIATIVVSTTGAGVTRAGYGVPLIVSHSAPWVERTRTYSSIAGVGADFAVNTPEYIAANKVFSQQPKVPKLKIGRAALVPTQQFLIGIANAGLSPYRLRVAVPTGVLMVSQDATYNPGAGATAWGPSLTWAAGDLIANNAKLYTCVQGGIGAGSGPSGTATGITEGLALWMFAGSGNTGQITNDAAANGLKAAVARLASPPVVGTGLGQLSSSFYGAPGSLQLQLQANAPGKFFGAQVYNRAALSIKQAQGDPGIATDLAAIKQADNNWYGLITLFNSEALVDAAAAWVESNTKLYAAASQDSAIATVALSTPATDVAADVKAASYARSFVFHHPSNDEFADAADVGKFFTVNPGGETWRMKTLAGVTAETYSDTEITNMRDKHAHYYYDLGGRFVVGGDAMTGSGEYVDVTRFLDWYTSELQADLADIEIANDKIPYTNPGIDLIESAVRKRNRAGIKAGGIAADPAPTVSAPDVNDVAASDKAARELSGVTSQFTLAGAIHHITVNVTATQ